MMIQRAQLYDLNDRWVRQYQIQIQIKPLRYRQGWTHFSLYLRDQGARLSAQVTPQGGYLEVPVLEGIHSRGGRWVKGWIEIGDYFPIVYFERGGLQPRPFNLSEEGIDQQIFQLLSEFIPAGGHLMFAYEVSYESPFHHETLLSLMRGIPPVCTAQGQLLFRSGFRVIKDWYLAEGGHEGPRKLWGEKPSNENESRDFDLRTFLQLLGFLAQRPNPDFFSLEIGSRTRASVLLGELNLQLPLSRLGEEVSRNYHDSSRVEELEEAAHRTCQHITQFVGLSPLVDERTKGKLSEISDACSAREVDVPPA